MKKMLLILTIIFCCASGNTYASDIVEAGKEIEIKDNASKSFVYKALVGWFSHDVWNMYRERYKAESLTTEEPEMKDIKVWIREAKNIPGTGEQRYTHIVRIFVPYPRVVVDEKKEMKTADMCIYAINADELAAYPNTDLIKKSVKRLNCFHKVVPK